MQVFYKGYLLEVESSSDPEYPWACYLVPPAPPDDDKKIRVEFELSAGCDCPDIESAIALAKHITDQVDASDLRSKCV